MRDVVIRKRASGVEAANYFISPSSPLTFLSPPYQLHTLLISRSLIPQCSDYIASGLAGGVRHRHTLFKLSIIALVQVNVGLLVKVSRSPVVDLASEARPKISTLIILTLELQRLKMEYLRAQVL